MRKSVYLAVIGLAGLYAMMTIQGPNGLPALSEKRQQIEVLQEQNATMAAENQRKALRIERLEKDRSLQELEIRKRLKLLHPGETQFILPETKPETSSEPEAEN